MFTLHTPFIPSLLLSPKLPHCLVMHHIALSINEIFLIHLFSLAGEATEVENLSSLSNSISVPVAAPQGAFTVQTVKQLQNSGGSCGDILTELHQTEVDFGQISCAQNQKYQRMNSGGVRDVCSSRASCTLCHRGI